MNTPKIRFKGFTDDWEQRKLGDVFEQTTNFVDPNKKEIELWSLTVEDGLTPKSERYNREFLVKKDTGFKEVRSGDIVYNPMNMTLGAVGYNGMSKSVAVSGYYTTMITNEGYDSYYINTWLKSPQAMALYKTFATGSLIEKQRVQFPTLSIIPATFPQYEEQVRIGYYFMRLDHLITLHQRKCDETKQLKKFMLQKMFPKNGEKNPEIRFEGFTDDWEQRKLGEVFNFHYGDGNNNPSNGGQYPVFGAGGIQGRYTKYNAENSIIIGHMGDAGCVSWGEGKHFVTYNGTITTPKDDVFTAKFGYYLLLNMNLRKYRGGSGLPFLTYDMLTEMETKCPNSKIETQEIADYFTQLDKLITLHQRKLEEMKKQKKALMQLLLTGIVRI